MERNKLSANQGNALLVGALLAPAAELLPGTAARAGAVGAAGMLAAVVLMLLAGWLASRLPGGLAAALGQRGWPGKTLLIIYVGWFQLLLTLRLVRAAQRLRLGGEQDGAAWFFVVVLGIVLLWMGRGSLGTLGRMAQVMTVALAVTGGAVLLLSLSQMEGGRLLTTRSWSLTELVWPGVQAASCGVFALFLYEDGPERRRLLGPVWLGLALGAGQLILLARFGPALTMELNSPFFQLAKGVRVEGGFQRVESLVAAVWVFADLLLLTGLLWSMRRAALAAWPHIKENGVVTGSVLLGVVLAVAALGNESRLPLYIVEGAVIPIGSLLLGIGVPAACLGLNIPSQKNSKKPENKC